MTTQPPTPLDGACYQYEQAQRALASAKQAMEQAEAEILALVEAKEEGAATTKTDFYKVTTTGRINRTVDDKEVEQMRASVPAEWFEQVFKLKPSLSITGMRKAEKSEFWPLFARAITSKPGKTSLEISRIPQE